MTSNTPHVTCLGAITAATLLADNPNLWPGGRWHAARATQPGRPDAIVLAHHDRIAGVLRIHRHAGPAHLVDAAARWLADRHGMRIVAPAATGRLNTGDDAA